MSGDLPGNGQSLRLLEVFDRLRSDLARDLAALEARIASDLSEVREDLRERDADLDERFSKHEAAMTAVVNEARADVQEFVISHGQTHEQMNNDRKAAHDRFDSFIQDSKLAKARTDGILSVLLFFINALGKHWQLVIGVLIALLGVLGGIRISVGQ